MNNKYEWKVSRRGWIDLIINDNNAGQEKAGYYSSSIISIHDLNYGVCGTWNIYLPKWVDPKNSDYPCWVRMEATTKEEAMALAELIATATYKGEDHE